MGVWVRVWGMHTPMPARALVCMCMFFLGVLEFLSLVYHESAAGFRRVCRCVCVCVYLCVCVCVWCVLSGMLIRGLCMW